MGKNCRLKELSSPSIPPLPSTKPDLINYLTILRTWHGTCSGLRWNPVFRRLPLLYPSEYPPLTPTVKRLSPILGAVIVAGGGIGYAVHEHHIAQTLRTQNQQVTAQLSATHMQLDTLTSKVDALVANTSMQATAPATSHAASANDRRANAYDPRFNKTQSQLDVQGKAVDAQAPPIGQHRSDLASTRNDLSNARTELSGSIARTHDQLVMLERRGERRYFEFDLTKSKEFKHEGPVSISLRKADSKHGFADLALVVDGRTPTQKHVNLYQPAMFYELKSQMPVEVVINDISKNHIHGYVSVPKHRPSELAVAPAAGTNPTSDSDQSASAQSTPRQRLPRPNEVDQE
jgi:hypothetical protein